jgi:hypothetical protein
VKRRDLMMGEERGRSIIQCAFNLDINNINGIGLQSSSRSLSNPNLCTSDATTIMLYCIISNLNLYEVCYLIAAAEGSDFAFSRLAKREG